MAYLGQGGGFPLVSTPSHTDEPLRSVHQLHRHLGRQVRPPSRQLRLVHRAGGYCGPRTDEGENRRPLEPHRVAQPHDARQLALAGQLIDPPSRYADQGRHLLSRISSAAISPPGEDMTNAPSQVTPAWARAKISDCVRGGIARLATSSRIEVSLFLGLRPLLLATSPAHRGIHIPARTGINASRTERRPFRAGRSPLLRTATGESPAGTCATTDVTRYQVAAGIQPGI
jgi:hypothetical protein